MNVKREQLNGKLIEEIEILKRSSVPKAVSSCKFDEFKAMLGNQSVK